MFRRPKTIYQWTEPQVVTRAIYESSRMSPVAKLMFTLFITAIFFTLFYFIPGPHRNYKTYLILAGMSLGIAMLLVYVGPWFTSRLKVKNTIDNYGVTRQMDSSTSRIEFDVAKGYEINAMQTSAGLYPIVIVYGKDESLILGALKTDIPEIVSALDSLKIKRLDDPEDSVITDH